jgi:hypothetical protein
LYTNDIRYAGSVNTADANRGRSVTLLLKTVAALKYSVCKVTGTSSRKVHQAVWRVRYLRQLPIRDSGSEHIVGLDGSKTVLKYMKVRRRALR